MNFCESLSQVFHAEFYYCPCFLLRVQELLFFVASFASTFPADVEAVERAAAIADAEGVNKIEATHLERILPQLLLDF